jgi:hypothetical protein
VKRSRIERRTPMPRSTKPIQRKTRMRTMSQQTARLNRRAKPARDALKAKRPFCWVCGSTRRRLTVHEIARGGLRSKAIDKPYACLVACWPCNRDDLNDATKWPIAKQLACLLVNNPLAFDLAAFNELRGRAETAVTMKDVDAYMPECL